MKTFMIGKLFNNVPVVYEKWKADAFNSDNTAPLVHEKCNFVIINPSKDNLLACVPYAFTLVPFREDIIVGNGDILSMPGLIDNSDDPWSADEFLLEGESATSVAKHFFKTAGGQLPPAMAAWLSRASTKVLWKHFRSEQIASLDDSTKDHTVRKLLEAMSK